jgi:hypothetical protein
MIDNYILINRKQKFWPVGDKKKIMQNTNEINRKIIR